MKLRNLSDLFLYELWTLCDAKTQAIAGLLHMSRLAGNCELREELKTDADNAGGTHLRYQNYHLQLSSDLTSDLRCNERFDHVK